MQTRSASRPEIGCASVAHKVSTGGVERMRTRSVSRTSPLVTPPLRDSHKFGPSEGKLHPASQSSIKRGRAATSNSPVTRRLSQLPTLLTHTYLEQSCHTSSCLIALEFALRKAVLNKVSRRHILHRSCFPPGPLGDKVQAWAAIREAVFTGEVSRRATCTAIQIAEQLTNARNAVRWALEEVAIGWAFPQPMENYRGTFRYDEALRYLQCGADQPTPADATIRRALVSIDVTRQAPADRNLGFLLSHGNAPSECPFLHIGTRCALCKNGYAPDGRRDYRRRRPLAVVTGHHFARCDSVDPFKVFAHDMSGNTRSIHCSNCGSATLVEPDIGGDLCVAVQQHGLSAIPPIMVLDTDYSQLGGAQMHFDASETQTLWLPIGTQHGSTDQVQIEYQLVGVVGHSPRGHFVTQVCVVDGEWYLFDDIKRRHGDDTVQGHRVPPPDGSPSSWTNAMFAGDYNPVELFYVRKSGIHVSPHRQAASKFSCTWRTLRDPIPTLRGGTMVLTAIPTREPSLSSPACHVSRIVEGGGLQNVGCSRFSTEHVGVLVAANSGRPGGSCGWGPGASGISSRHLHAGHTTQEEDIVANWLLTHTFNSAGDVSTTSFNEKLEKFAATAFGCIQSAWGLPSTSRLGNMTRQGVDYTSEGVVGRDYADVWVVPGVHLSYKEKCECSDQCWLDHTNQFASNLYFAAAPNAGSVGTPTGSMARTLNHRASEDEELFLDGVRWALRTSLCAMAEDGVQVVLLPLLGGGVYSGRWGGPAYLDAFTYLVKQVLHETIIGTNRSLSAYFTQVVIVTIR